MRRPRRLPAALRSGPLAVVASNLVAPVGVVAFGWSAAVLLGVFVCELAAVLCWSVVRMPFAAKRPNDALDGRLLGPLRDARGATRLPGPLPPVYLRNLPTLVVTVVLFAPLELAVAVGVFALADPAVTDTEATWILLGGLGAFLVRGVETYADYFRGGGYRDHSPRSVLLRPFRHFFGVGALLFVAGPLAGSGVVGGDAVLWVALAGKLLYDLRAERVDADPDRQGLFYRLYGGAETEVDPVPVAVPDGDPALRVRPPRRVAIADACYRGVRYTLTSGVLLLYGVAAAMAVLGATLPFVLAPLAAAGGFAAVRAASRYVRYGALEYRLYPDDGLLVAHDALLDEPRARLEREAVTGLSVARDAVDRAFGTRTLRLDADENDDPPGNGLTVPDPDLLGDDDANDSRPLSVVHVGDDETDALVDAFGVAWLVERDTDRRAAGE